MKKSIFLLAFILAFGTVFSQETNFWTKAQNQQKKIIVNSGKAEISSFQMFTLEFKELKEALSEVHLRGENSRETKVIVEFPNAEGFMERFKIIEAPVLHPELEVKYPGIKSYAGQGVDNPASVLRFSISEQRGFHGMVLDGNGDDYFIDPMNNEPSSYIVYKKKNYSRSELDFECLMDGTEFVPEETEHRDKAADDKKLRKYRLALSCTAEYGNIFVPATGTHEEKIAAILAQMNITMTRVNGVYETDLAVTMEIIPNNDTIMYYGDVNADPWNGEYNTTTQNVIDNAVGDANYDIGHNFNTSGGGNAGCIGCVCVSGQKGSGMTGSSYPVGDPFDIDYVAHEMGHQFGGWHTMNTCARSGNGTTEVEPTSGSTIMGYAGICSYNVQNNSDAYFAYVNIRDITENVQVGTSSSCPEIIDLDNEPPTADAGSDYTIPKSTPFILTGEGSDPDGDAITFTWEQNDPEEAPSASAPQPTWAVGPLFRSVEGTTEPARYFPPIQYVVAGNLTPAYQVIPSVGRQMEFSLVVKDMVAGGGQTADDIMMITVDDVSGSFEITQPNENTTLYVADGYTVMWDVAGTNGSPVNCSHVNILLSTDGGYTYDEVLAENTENDGEEFIEVPNHDGVETCRIKIEAVDNIFYDISDANFTIIDNTGINEVEEGKLVNIFPNPSYNELNINYASQIEVQQIVIKSINGSLVMKVDKGVTSIDISQLNQGVYSLNIQTSKGNIIKKFIKL